MRLTELKRRRMEAGLRQLDVCVRLGLQPSKYSLIENGWLKPSAELLKAIEDIIARSSREEA